MPSTHSVSSTEVHPTVSRDRIAFPASDNELHAVGHTEDERSIGISYTHASNRFKIQQQTKVTQC